MEPELAKILDDCIDKINDTTSIEVCLAYHPQIRKELEPLLYTSKAISGTEVIQPTEEFRKTAKGRLMARIAEDGIQEKGTGWKSRMFPFLGTFTEACDGFWRIFDSVKRGAIPFALTLVLIFISVLSVANMVPSTSSMNAGCTLTVLNGAVDVLAPEVAASQPGIDGMTLGVGTRVITSQDSKALLTFFDGSTLVIEPGTDIEIQELTVTDEQSISIVLKQWMGKTWSRVVKMTDAGSHYEIQTPSAVAVVRGTYFSTEVDEEGETEVNTREGLVSVFAQGDEVLVSPGRQTTVLLGSPPCRPVFIAPGTDDSEDQDGADYLVMNNNGQGNAYGLDKPNNGQGNAYGQDKVINGITNIYSWENQYNGNAYGLDEDKDKDKDKDKDNNGKAKGKNKDSDDTGIPPGNVQPLDDTEPVEDPAPDKDGDQDTDNDEPVDEEPDEDNDQDMDNDESVDEDPDEDEDEDEDEDDETDDEKDKKDEDKDK